MTDREAILRSLRLILDWLGGPRGGFYQPTPKAREEARELVKEIDGLLGPITEPPEV